MTVVRVYTVVSKNPLFKLEALYIAEILQREGTVWHRTCYSDATNKPWYNVHVATYKNISLVEPIGSQDECQ